MSQLFDLYVGNQKEALAIWDYTDDCPEGTDVPAFDELKQLSLLSLFKEIELPPRNWGVLSSKSEQTAQIYHQHFALLYPSDIGKSRFVSQFPQHLVASLAAISDDSISALADRWISIEPSFAEFKWSREDVELLLLNVCNTCKRAINEGKHVLFRFSL